MLDLLLLRDGELLASDLLVPVANSVGDHLVLGLLNCALVVLRAGLEDMLLDEVDG